MPTPPANGQEGQYAGSGERKIARHTSQNRTRFVSCTPINATPNPFNPNKMMQGTPNSHVVPIHITAILSVLFDFPRAFNAPSIGKEHGANRLPKQKR